MSAAVDSHGDWIYALTASTPVRLDAQTLATIAHRLDVEEDAMLRAVRGLVRVSADEHATAFDMRTNTWQVDLPASVVKSVLCGSVTAIVLQLMGADSIPPTVLALVAPFLFEIERVEVSPSDVALHAVLTEAASGQQLHVDQLYSRLPDAVRAELSVIDFGNLLDRLIAARLATIEVGGVRLEPPGRARAFRVLIR